MTDDRDWAGYWLARAKLNASMGTCSSRKVGAVLVKNRRSFADGFNGNLPGATHCDQGGCARCASRVGSDLPPPVVVRQSDLTPEQRRDPTAASHGVGLLVIPDELPPSLGDEDAFFNKIQKAMTAPVAAGGDLDRCCCVHAETNVISYCARRGISTDGATCYVTTRPCHDCVKLMASAGVVHVVYDEEYPSSYETPPTMRITQFLRSQSRTSR